MDSWRSVQTQSIVAYSSTCRSNTDTFSFFRTPTRDFKRRICPTRTANDRAKSQGARCLSRIVDLLLRNGFLACVKTINFYGKPCTRYYSTARLNGRWSVENEITGTREWHVACGDDVKLNEPV